MQIIKLTSVTIHNFKGISDLSVKLDGNDIDIFGDNDAGKTTIYDAFLWCLFNKDSKDRTKIKWMPLDSDGNPIHGLTTSVKVVLSINGVSKTFEKRRIDKAVTKRNSEAKCYEDVAKYLIDEIETSTKRVYDQEVENVLNQDTFKNLTSVTYFCEQLSPEERRESLFNYFGTKTDEEIINETKELHPLIQIMNGNDVNTARARVSQELKQINETLKNIPVKIEGIQAALPEIESLNQEGLLTERNELTQKKNTIESELISIRNGGNVGELLSQLRSKQEELTAARLQFENQQNVKLNGIEQGKSKVFADLNKAHELATEQENGVKEINRSVTETEAYIKKLDEEHQRLIDEYDLVDGQGFMSVNYKKQPFDENSLSCQHCHRPYELDAQEEMKAHHEQEEQKKFDEILEKNKEAQQKFQADKESKLEKIREQGINNNKEREIVEKQLLELKEKLLVSLEAEKKAKNHAEKIAKDMEDFNKQIQLLESEKVIFETTKQYEKITQEITKLNEYVEQGNESIFDQTQEKTKGIEAIEKEIAAVDEQLAQVKEHERQLSIIEEFNDQERNLSERKGEVLSQLVLFEEFYITKRDLLQDQINSHFSVVEWKLFDFYEDGGLNESVCEPMINGVPFSGLNNGSCMQAGLDVSNTLMKQEGYIVPLFIDNAEGLTNHKRKAVDVDTQVIALYVSEKDKNLRVEQHKTEMAGGF